MMPNDQIRYAQLFRLHQRRRYFHEPAFDGSMVMLAAVASILLVIFRAL